MPLNVAKQKHISVIKNLIEQEYKYDLLFFFFFFQSSYSSKCNEVNVMHLYMLYAYIAYIKSVKLFFADKDGVKQII